ETKPFFHTHHIREAARKSGSLLFSCPVPQLHDAVPAPLPLPGGLQGPFTGRGLPDERAALFFNSSAFITFAAHRDPTISFSPGIAESRNACSIRNRLQDPQTLCPQLPGDRLHSESTGIGAS